MSGKTPNEILREILAKKTEQANATLSPAVASASPAVASASPAVASASPAVAEAVPVAVEVASATVQAEAKVGGQTETITEEQLFPLSKQLDKRMPVSYVTVKTGMTINLGNYSNGKVDVSISVPVGFEITPEYQQKINEAYEFGKAFTESKTREQVKKLIDFAKTRQ